MTDEAAGDASLGRVLFITGRLAEPALRRVLAEMAPPFAYDVTVLRITVAALMTTPWIAHVLDELPEGIDLVLIPGLCEGNPQVIGDKFGVRVEKGPKDLREIPDHVRKEMEFLFVERIENVLAEAIPALTEKLMVAKNLDVVKP